MLESKWLRRMGVSVQPSPGCTKGHESYIAATRRKVGRTFTVSRSFCKAHGAPCPPTACRECQVQRVQSTKITGLEKSARQGMPSTPCPTRAHQATPVVHRHPLDRGHDFASLLPNPNPKSPPRTHLPSPCPHPTTSSHTRLPSKSLHKGAHGARQVQTDYSFGGGTTFDTCD